MSSRKPGNRTIGDDAARARKLLEKNAPTTLSATTDRAVNLSAAPQNLGEYCAVVIAGPTGHKQFTVHHPIGITDLVASDWVITMTDQVQATLARAKDPRQGEINQLRTRARAQMAATAGKLLQEELNGVITYFYPNKVGGDSRNALLAQAQAGLKNERAQLEASIKDLEQLTDITVTEFGQRKGAIMNRIQALRPLDYLKEDVRAAEVELQSYWDRDTIKQAVETACPQTYRTLTGVHGDVAQKAIPGARGLTVQQVMDRLGLAMSQLQFKSEAAAADTAASAPQSTLKDRLLGRRTPSSPMKESSEKDGAGATAPKKA